MFGLNVNVQSDLIKFRVEVVLLRITKRHQSELRREHSRQR